jgi:hypothetical protein
MRIAAVLLALTAGAAAQIRTLGVCEALNSTISREEVVIQGRLTLWQHGMAFFEEPNAAPCPGWRRRFFTAPAAIDITFESIPEARTPIRREEALEFLRKISARSVRGTVTIPSLSLRGVLAKKFWPCIFRARGGEWIGQGFGANGAYLAELIVTEIPSGF